MLKNVRSGFHYVLNRMKGRIRYFNEETNNDCWVVDALQQKQNGFFIEAGAWDGIKASATYALEKYFGWRGLLVEPGPAFLQLQKNRQKSICVNKILSDKKSAEEFVSFPDFNYGYSCTKENFVKNQSKILKAHNKKKVAFEETLIETVPLADLLEEHNAPTIIDFLSLDVEGSELKILKNFPFHKYKFRCISIEGDECDKLLLSKGYKKVRFGVKHTEVRGAG